MIHQNFTVYYSHCTTLKIVYNTIKTMPQGAKYHMYPVARTWKAKIRTMLWIFSGTLVWKTEKDRCWSSGIRKYHFYSTTNNRQFDHTLKWTRKSRHERHDRRNGGTRCQIAFRSLAKYFKMLQMHIIEVWTVNEERWG